MIEVDIFEESLESKLPRIGWTCTYTPEEVIYATGFHPFHILEDIPSAKLADTYLHHNLCPYVRSCLDFGLREKSEAFKGIVIVNSCDAMHSLYHVWRQYIPSSAFVHFMNLPKVSSSLAVELYKQEIQDLIAALESHFGCRIDDRALRKAIKVFNESRDLLRNLYEMRKNAILSLKGSQVFKIIQASQRMPKEIFNQKLKNFLAGIKQKEAKRAQSEGPRIMIVGSLLHNTQLFEIVEDAGAFVVCDDLCSGSRYFDGDVEEGVDLLRSLSTRYLQKAPCARMKNTELRLGREKKLVEECQVNGVIYQTMKFCDNHLYDYPLHREFFEEMGLPVLQIEEDFIGGNIGQIKTRIEAFIEML